MGYLHVDPGGFHVSLGVCMFISGVCTGIWELAWVFGSLHVVLGCFARGSGLFSHGAMGLHVGGGGARGSGSLHVNWGCGHVGLGFTQASGFVCTWIWGFEYGSGESSHVDLGVFEHGSQVGARAAGCVHANLRSSHVALGDLHVDMWTSGGFSYSHAQAGVRAWEGCWHACHHMRSLALDPHARGWARVYEGQLSHTLTPPRMSPRPAVLRGAPGEAPGHHQDPELA